MNNFRGISFRQNRIHSFFLLLKLTLFCRRGRKGRDRTCMCLRKKLYRTAALKYESAPEPRPARFSPQHKTCPVKSRRCPHLRDRSSVLLYPRLWPRSLFVTHPSMGRTLFFCLVFRLLLCLVPAHVAYAADLTVIEDHNISLLVCYLSGADTHIGNLTRYAPDTHAVAHID